MQTYLLGKPEELCSTEVCPCLSIYGSFQMEFVDFAEAEMVLSVNQEGQLYNLTEQLKRYRAN